jgi:antitoxin PrlF
MPMPLAQSKLTAQGQISVPAEVRKRLGVGPGAILEWDERGGEVVVRRAGRHTSAQVHEVLFAGGKPKPKAPVNVKEGIKKYIREKHARR